MNLVKRILLLVLMVLMVPGALRAAPPTAQDKDDYERLIEILFSGSPDNKKMAKDALRAMGDTGIRLLKADCKDITGIRGAFAWSILREFLAKKDAETLRDFARDDLDDVAHQWNRTYTDKKSSKDEQKRLQQLVSDFVDLLIASPKERDFDRLLDALEFSLIKGDTKADYHAEFEVWQKVWTHVNRKISASKDIREIRGWQRTLDKHFRTYSQRKDYVKRRAIQAYQTTMLVLIHRVNELRDE